MSDRTVATDALATLGTIIGPEAKRDAIHVAVEPVTAGQVLQPGAHVGFLEDGCVGESKTPVGIIDPFLPTPVQLGQRVWLFVYPRQITSLRHVWSHPSFDDEPFNVRNTSEQWLREFIGRCAGEDQYEQVMQIVGEIAEGRYYEDEYIVIRGRDAHGEIPPEFWVHAAIVLGKPIKGARPTYFSCSC